uniref:hypothetical protein n=1 Tax=Rodentibacter caecimuris TaxID=1796644 RepID=UPI003671ADE1
MSSLPLLSIAIWTPILFGALILAMGSDRNVGVVRGIALAGALISFLVTLPLYAGFDASSAAMPSPGSTATTGAPRVCSGPVAIDLLAEMSSEIRYVAGDQRRRCWIVFVETERQSFRVAAISARHLESILDAHPLSLVLPLHEVVARAAERLDALRAKKSKEA